MLVTSEILVDGQVYGHSKDSAWNAKMNEVVIELYQNML